MNNKGFIAINRKLFEHKLWCEERVYSRFEAWLDLIQAVGFEDAKQYFGTTVVVIKRGQLVASSRFLASRWGWSRTKVETYLQLLINDKMITKSHRKDIGQTLITLCNYDGYNAVPKIKKPPKEPVESQHRASTEPNISNINNLNNTNNIPPIVPQRVTGKELFDKFRKSYGGTTRGLDTEFKQLQRHKDWKLIIPLLYPALEKEIQWRDATAKAEQWCPEWANLSTWINQKRWEQEFPKVKQKENKKENQHGTRRIRVIQ